MRTCGYVQRAQVPRPGWTGSPGPYCELGKIIKRDTLPRSWDTTRSSARIDISVRGRERRGCLRVDIRLVGSGCLHIFNLHLGTSYFERRKQARRLFRQQILTGQRLLGSRIILGDFNEWTKGLAS
jgi:endonuclease/exonuclease/phosphatase family metal-dependent hydrolase